MSIATRDLVIGYGACEVGRIDDLALRDGETFCLLGPNGCGKSTLFKTLLGLIPALGGRVELDGHDLGHQSRSAIARRIAYVPQAQTAAFPFSVREMVLMGRAVHLRLFAVPSRGDREIAEDALRGLGIEHLAQRIYTDISGGERQLVLIARALAQQAEIFVLDEPTASLDFGNQIRVLDRIRRLSMAGRSVVFATHNPDHAFLCADRVALIQEGRIAALGTPDETVTAERLKNIYGVEVTVATLPGSERRVCVPVLGSHGVGRRTGMPF